MEFGLYVVMELVPTENTLLYFPFQECFVTMKEQTWDSNIDVTNTEIVQTFNIDIKLITARNLSRLYTLL